MKSLHCHHHYTTTTLVTALIFGRVVVSDAVYSSGGHDDNTFLNRNGTVNKQRPGVASESRRSRHVTEGWYGPNRSLAIATLRGEDGVAAKRRSAHEPTTVRDDPGPTLRTPQLSTNCQSPAGCRSRRRGGGSPARRSGGEGQGGGGLRGAGRGALGAGRSRVVGERRAGRARRSSLRNSPRPFTL